MQRPIAIGLSPNTEESDYLLAFKMLLSPWEHFNNSYVKLLEQWFRNFFAVSYAISFNSGRSAFLAILKTLDINQNDEILLQSFTCVVVPNAILAAGAKPIYVDVMENFTMDPNDLEKKITSKSRAILVQHTFGIPSSMKEIVAIAKKHKLTLIEDVAHSIGGEYNEKKLGSFGHAAFFSFGRDKAFSSVFGGIAITNKEELGKKLRMYQRSLQKPSLFWTIQQLLHPVASSIILPLYHILSLGKVLLFILQKLQVLSFPVSLNERKSQIQSLSVRKMPNQLAALALHQLKRLREFNKKRIEFSKLYTQALQESSFRFSQFEGIPLLRFPVLSPEREAIITHFKKNGILLGNWYSSIIDPKGTDFKKVNYEIGSCLLAESYAQEVLNLPTYPTLKKSDVQKIISVLRGYAQHTGN